MVRQRSNFEQILDTSARRLDPNVEETWIFGKEERRYVPGVATFLSGNSASHTAPDPYPRLAVAFHAIRSHCG